MVPTRPTFRDLVDPLAAFMLVILGLPGLVWIARIAVLVLTYQPEAN